jgi:hypothetical protein
MTPNLTRQTRPNIRPSTKPQWTGLEGTKKARVGKQQPKKRREMRLNARPKVLSMKQILDLSRNGPRHETRYKGKVH